MNKTYNEKRFTVVLKVTRIAYTIINILIWIGLVGAVIAGIGLLVVGAEALTVSVVDFPNLPEQLDRFNIIWEELVGERSIAFQFPLLIASGSLFIVSGLSIWVVRQIRGILKDVESQEPFSDQNAKRLFNISYTLVGFSIITPLTASLFSWSIVRQFEFAGRDGFNFSLNFTVLFMAALIYILAHIFSYGAHLQEEVDGTV